MISLKGRGAPIFYDLLQLTLGGFFIVRNLR